MREILKFRNCSRKIGKSYFGKVVMSYWRTIAMTGKEINRVKVLEMAVELRNESPKKQEQHNYESVNATFRVHCPTIDKWEIAGLFRDIERNPATVG